MNPDLIELVKTRLSNPLPGVEAQMKMAPASRRQLMTPPENARLGGVMVLLLEGDKAWNTVLIRRTEDGKTHGGQISFPGGQYDPSDYNIIATALRECEEEVGVRSDGIEVLGTLTPLYIPPSNFLITPTIGYIASAPKFVPSEREVQEIIKVPLSLLFDPAVKRDELIKPSGPGQDKIQTRVYALDEDLIIWGATAMILSELEHLCSMP